MGNWSEEDVLGIHRRHMTKLDRAGMSFMGLLIKVAIWATWAGM